MAFEVKIAKKVLIVFPIRRREVDTAGQGGVVAGDHSVNYKVAEDLEF